MQSQFLRIKARIKKEDIVFFSWIIESYEEIGVMRTIDAGEGLVEFFVSPFFEEEFYNIMSSLEEKIEFTECEDCHDRN